ncbi:MAG: hypothetical protein R3E79_32240 [Caldilineaceae bacterium]
MPGPGSDDPDTPFFGDPTDTIVVIPPTGLMPEEEPVSGSSAHCGALTPAASLNIM